MYKFSRTDPAANPAHYMYAAYGGADFLADYLRDRRSLLESIGPVGDLPPWTPLALPSLPTEIDTLQVLTACVACPPGHAGRTALADFFLRKVEVARILRRAYGVTGSPATQAGAATPVYAMAASLIADEIARSSGVGRLRWMNGLLKTLDIVSLHRDEYRGRPEVAHIRHAVEIETAAVTGDASALGIRIPA